MKAIKQLTLLLIYAWTINSIAQDQPVLDSLLKRLPNEQSDTIKVKLLNSIAWEYRNNNLDLVLIYADSALILAEKINYSRGKVRSYFNVGNLYYIQGDYPKTIENYLKALKILEEVGDKEGIANALMGVGNVHSAQGNIEQGIDYQLRALAIREEINDSLGLAASYNNLGSIYIETGDYMKALEYHLESMHIKQALGNWKGLSSSYGNIGEIYLVMGNYKQALIYQQKALEIREKLNNKKGLVFSYTDMGNVYLEQQEYHKALQSHLKALELAREVKYGQGIRNALNAISTTYEKLNQYEEALDYHKMLLQVNDSLFNVDKAAAMTELEKIYKTEQHQKEMEILTKEKEFEINMQKEQVKLQRFYVGAAILALLLTLGLAYSLYKRYRLKNKANRILEEKNIKIQEQADIIGERNQQITDSIEYAQSLQEAILPSGTILKKWFSDYFIFYRPRDLVSGDFYWIHEDGNEVFVAVVDCTGHGVPGAFVSMLGNDLLNQIIINQGERNPGAILTALNQGVKKVFTRNELNHNPHEGMDMVLIRINTDTKELSLAGAKNKMIHINSEGIKEFAGDDVSIGGSTDNEFQFRTTTLLLNSNETLYLTTDGYKDQFGGPKGKKLKHQKFIEILKENQNLSMANQSKVLEQEFIQWKGDMLQVDDVCVIGLRI